MKTLRISGIILLLLAVSFLSAGCFDVNSNFRNVRNHLLKAAGSKYEKDQEFALGSVSMAVVKQVVKSSHDDKQNIELIKNISGLQLGIYKKKNDVGKAETDVPDAESFNEICRMMEKGGYIKMVRSINKNEVSAVFLKLNKQQNLTKMLVISVNQNELVLIDIAGNLDRLFETALRDKGLGKLAIKY
ncbi:MAG TPA: hypothetical protein VHO03_00225 [Ignavibacteriales bacterium]|nr:hypothetical protein [Ignavibacteriales bacterium]